MSTPNNAPVWELLAKCLQQSIADGKFSSEKFFPLWFREHGNAYFFLFKKNLSVTNIQHAELLALARQHISRRDAKEPIASLAFHTAAAFTQNLERLVASVLESADFSDEDLLHLSELYWPIIEKSIVVDSFFTSSALFIPPHLNIDLLRVCAESGYIHSCGYALFVRKLRKAVQNDFYNSISRHLMKHPEWIGKLQFGPYSVEDFKGDKAVGHIKDSLQDGIDGVKIRVEKLHMKHRSLVDVLADLTIHFKDRLTFIRSGDYKTNHPERSDATLWLIADRSINRTNPKTAGSDLYYLCYHQLYFNNSPFHLFDENKPGWVAHTTIPHTLLGAMLNITKPWTTTREISICDPFGGTGTTWFEGLKFENVRRTVGDINPMLPLLIKDNLSVFAMGHNELKRLATDLANLVGNVTKHSDETDSESVQEVLSINSADSEARFSPIYTRSLNFIGRLRDGKRGPIQSFDFTSEIVQEVGGFSFFDRIVLYIALRAELRFQSAYTRGTKQRTTAFAQEAEYLIEELVSLSEWADRQSSTFLETGLFSVFPGHYSRYCSISRNCILDATKNISSGSAFLVRDARRIEENSYDVVITDPPYGFNTTEDSLQLSQLYAEMIVRLVAAVKGGGHLVVCLPAEALTGRELPACTNAQIVIAQVLRAADLLEREVFTPAMAAPPLSVPPYYWNSSALRRTILHFRIRDKPICEIGSVETKKRPPSYDGGQDNAG